MWKVDDFRAFKGYTLRQMADDTGLSISLLSRICNGRIPISQKVYNKLLMTYGVEFEGLAEPRVIETEWHKKYKQLKIQYKLLQDQVLVLEKKIQKIKETIQ